MEAKSWAPLLSLVTCVGCCSGCGRGNEITRYTATVPEALFETGHATSGFARSTTSGEPSRMLAAIVPRGKRTWFFKMTGPDQAVRDQVDNFVALLTSVQFVGDAEQPTWELPGEWRQHGPSGMRFAMLETEVGGQMLQTTVIPLDSPEDDPDGYILSNINRWRGQMGLAPVASIIPPMESAARCNVEHLELDDRTAVTWVNLVGELGPQADSLAATSPFLSADHPPITGLPLHDAGTKLTYEVPEGWTSGKAGGMRLAAFDVVDGENRAEVTVISLPESGGDRLANVNRWRKELQLDDISANQLEQHLEIIPMDSGTGDFVHLKGQTESGTQEAILAVMVDFGKSTFFFKWKGVAVFAENQREPFLAFVRSVRFLTDDWAVDE